MRRTVTPELLDSDSGTPAEIAASLADLGCINRWFGGIATLCGLVEKVAARTDQKSFTLLDVGAGTGEVTMQAVKRLARSNIELQPTIFDRAITHFGRDRNGRSQALVGDALNLPFGSNSFDLVACSTFAHHLEPQQLRQFVDRALEAAKVAVLINDLRRSALHLALVYAGFPLFRSRITRHDGPVSIRRSYTVEEMLDMLRRTRAGGVEIENYYLYRMGAIAWKR
jgi:SAM-dependent methyltransferase